MKEGHAFYAAIHEPRELRKDVLLSQKSILDSLKKYEHIRAIRAEKEMRAQELRKMLAAVRLVVNQMKTMLPASAVKSKLPETRQAPTPSAKAEARQRKTKLQILEDELAKIEGKLTSLE
ncbi:hypothetical protein HY493_04025 [Candidatus Woesearchaeota archaeon]|nr:hypothetical protein [Candidatus Woesearchaeota archaeon]